MINAISIFEVRSLEFIGNEYKRCYYCGEKIGIFARRCDFCGSLLKPELDRIYYNQAYQFNAPNVNQSAYDNAIIDERVETAGKVESAEKAVNISDLEVKFLPGTYVRNRLSNNLKVFITVISSVIPGIGQLIGVILAIIFINSEEHDMRSFGKALLVSSVILFIITFLLFILAILTYFQYYAITS